MPHIHIFKSDFEIFTRGTSVCLLKSLKHSHSENSQKRSYRENVNMTYLKQISGPFRNHKFQMVYLRKYSETKFEILSNLLVYFSLDPWKFYSLKSPRKEVIAKFSN